MRRHINTQPAFPRRRTPPPPFLVPNDLGRKQPRAPARAAGAGEGAEQEGERVAGEARLRHTTAAPAAWVAARLRAWLAFPRHEADSLACKSLRSVRGRHTQRPAEPGAGTSRREFKAEQAPRVLAAGRGGGWAGRGVKGQN